MNRIPLSRFPTVECDDEDIITAYEWFRSYLSQSDWLKKKNAIESYLSKGLQPVDFSESVANGIRIVIDDDRMGWYLYLVYTYIYERHKYEYFQGARILPIFKRLGKNIDFVKSIEGIDKKVRDLLRKRSSEADAILFEILTGLLWVINGWKATILEEKQGEEGRKPDFLMTKGDEQWQVECKRQSKTADYTYRETQKRLTLINEIKELLLDNNILLDITFHVELKSLPDNYLKDLLVNIITGIDDSGSVISNTEVDIKISKIDTIKINKHLENYYVKNHSPQLLELIAGRAVDHSGFTSGIKGALFFLGEGNVNNSYISEIVNTFGVQCYCDAEASIMAKARDVKKQIYSAIKQFDSKIGSIIHIGMETFDGPTVERARLEKIMETMENFNTEDNNLCWIYYHYFQSYTRSDREWYFDETVNAVTSLVNPILPVPKHFLIVPEEEVSIIDGSHWERDVP